MRSLALPNSTTAASDAFETRVLSVLLVLLFVTYASLGKNIFTNGIDESASSGDFISTYVGYVRFVICIVSIVYVVMRHTFDALGKGIPWLFLPFVLWAVMSSAWSDDPWVTFRNSMFLVLIFFAMPLVIYELGLVSTARVILHMIAVVLIASAFFAIVFPTIGRHMSLTTWAAHAGRWRGIFGHKNGLGPWAAYGLIFLCTHSWMVRGPRLYWWLARLCAALCLVLSGSATSMVAAIFLVAASVVFSIRRRTSNDLTMLVIVVGGLAAVILYALFSEQLFGLLGREDTLTGRTDVWSLALRHINENFWLGTGYLTTGGPEFLQDMMNTVFQEIPGAENAYLTEMLELGAVGLFAFFIPVTIGLARAFAWWPVLPRDQQSALEMMILIVSAALVMGYTESTPFICTGYDGVVTFPAAFGLALLPRMPGVKSWHTPRLRALLAHAQNARPAHLRFLK